jgi:hypothetical protein
VSSAGSVCVDCSARHKATDGTVCVQDTEEEFAFLIVLCQSAVCS